jgi:5-methylcytosine-specific restriction endonuclease McrA
MSYAKYQRSREWKIWRHRIIVRDHYTCSRCGKQTRSLQVHHLHYRNGRCPHPDDVETLCGACHLDESKKSGHLKKQEG